MRPPLTPPFPPSLPPSRPLHFRVILIGGDASGLRHAISTFIQAARLCNAVQPWEEEDDNPMQGGGIPPLRIVDWPELANRGFMLDVSRDKVQSRRI